MENPSNKLYTKKGEFIMLRNYPTIEIKEDPNYYSALKILNSIVNREIPPNNVLTDIYGNLTPLIISHLEKYFEDFPVECIKVRQHYECTSVISEARLLLEQNLNFARLHSKILNNQIPEIDEISPVYGEYSGTVQKILELYRKNKLKRRCGVPAAAHPSRVGGMVYTLRFDSDGSSKFCTAAFLHDCIEDLIKFKARASDHYGLRGLESFINVYIPEELQPNIKLLTNHYSLILNYLKYLLTLTDTHVNTKNLLKEMDNLRLWEWSLSENVKKLSDLLTRRISETPALSDPKWESYKELYIKEMADNALTMSDFRTFEIKAIDLADNSHSNAALSMSEKLKNIQKLGIWASQGYRLQTGWKPTNNFIQEVFEDALVYSENIVIKDFLEPVSKQDFFASALYKIEELKSIFYIE